MRRITEILLLILLLVPVSVFPQGINQDVKSSVVNSVLSSRGEAYIGITPSLHKSFLSGMSELIPDKQTDSLYYFYVNKKQFDQIQERGVEYQLFTAPSMIGPVKMASTPDEILAGLAYPTYQQYLDLMEKFRNDYPEICTIDTIGYSYGGKLILAARLQNGEYKPGERPIVLYSSSMHGDEVVGYSLMLMLINDLLKNSVGSSQVSAILNNLVLIINPLSNPDGAYFQSDNSLYGAIRGTLKPAANGINDLNRNYHDISLGMNYSYSGLQKENVEMVRYMEKFPPSLSANFHTGAEILNYPWDTWYAYERKHSDNDWFIEICKDYVGLARLTDSGYLRLYPEGYVFGSEWYRIEGGRQDFVTYCLRGRELTIELSDVKLPNISQIPGFWTKNHQALINLIEKAEYGIHGIVTDSVTSKPVEAKIEIQGYDKDESYLYSHAESGKFFRYLPEGSYSLQISAEGYPPKLIKAEVSKNMRTDLIVELSKQQLGILIKRDPGSNDLVIELTDDGSEVFTADLYDLSGRKVTEKIFIGSTGTLNSGKIQGIYILKVKSDIQSETRLVFFPPY
jgi:hypothetical protein